MISYAPSVSTFVVSHCFEDGPAPQNQRLMIPKTSNEPYVVFYEAKQIGDGTIPQCYYGARHLCRFSGYIFRSGLYHLAAG